MSRLISPGQGLILRSAQKDDQYLLELRNETNLISQKLFGIRKWMAIRKELEALTNLTYYLVTTLSGLQTLGEEYVNIVQTDGNNLRVPSFKRRLTMMTWHSLGSIFVSHSFNKIQRLLEDTRVQLPQYLEHNNRRERLISLIPYLQNLLTIFDRLHLILFYFNGNYYHISKRLTYVKYTLTRRLSSYDSNVYKILAWVTLSQLCLSIYIQYYSSLIANYKSQSLKKESCNKSDSDERSLSDNVEPSEKCSLCLEQRQDSTSTPCGHLYCWYCITEWLQMKKQCPICRESVDLSRLICLNNF